MILKYQTGQEIRKGDRVLYHGEPAGIDFVAIVPGDPETDWYVEEYGGGIMISDPNVSGHTFIPANHLDEYEDLKFLSRTGSGRK